MNDAEDADIWPISALTYLVIPINSTDDENDCGRIAGLQRYVQWILTNQNAASIAQGLQWAIMPNVIASRAVAILSAMSCVGRDGVSRLVTQFSDNDLVGTTFIRGSGSSMQAQLQQALSNKFYIESMISISYSPSSSGQGIKQLLSGLVDFAASEIIVDRADPMVLKRNLNMIPVFAGAVVVTFNNPDARGLILTRTLTSNIFLGFKYSWADREILSANAGDPEFRTPAAAFVRVVRRETSGTSRVFIQALKSFQANSSDQSNINFNSSTWPVSQYLTGSDVQCIFSNCSEMTGCLSNEVWIAGQCQSRDNVIEACFIVVFVVFGMASLLIWYKIKLKLRASLKDEEIANWRIKEEDLDFGDPRELIGSGTFGQVYRARYRGTNVAVKFIKINVIPERSSLPKSMMASWRGNRVASISAEVAPEILWNSRQAIMSETASSTSDPQRISLNSIDQVQLSNERWLESVRALNVARHPSICTLLGFISEPHPAFVMEYMESGSLYDVLRNVSFQLDEADLFTFVRDVCQGMRYLHEASTPMIHGDLKSSNVLIDSHLRAKVADFGFVQLRVRPAPTSSLTRLPSSTKSARSSFSLSMLATQGANLAHIAPEILRQECGPSKEADVYAFGILLVEVLTRKNVYPDEDLNSIIQEVKDRQTNRRPAIPDNVAEPFKHLMQECWHSNPIQRPSFEVVSSRLREVDPFLTIEGESFNSCNPSAPCANLNPATSWRDSGKPNSRPRSMADMRKDRNASSVLKSLFPADVAESLLKGEKVEPVTKDMVSVFFSDIVGFTTLSDTLPPSKVSDMINRLFGQFDSLADKYEVYKIDTIGDAYLAVTNLVTNQHDRHASVLAR
eukprot:CAMPEP_0113710804 /NCGR_PEP_ID=MMETSP0038_2-20120614/30374_1 /TAXON_ID=2898 /ORGANISM="Cryptomonas paramecium" /LENGTH=851 /DNA_ID=CAMNT_0000636929 /DNA_START=237 /DNA_END=2788 /DNA_ORIENTATION=+ /assembly_acc=CAM_ASM_000170